VATRDEHHPNPNSTLIAVLLSDFIIFGPQQQLTAADNHKSMTKLLSASAVVGLRGQGHHQEARSISLDISD